MTIPPDMLATLKDIVTKAVDRAGANASLAKDFVAADVKALPDLHHALADEQLGQMYWNKVRDEQRRRGIRIGGTPQPSAEEQRERIAIAARGMLARDPDLLSKLKAQRASKSKPRTHKAETTDESQ
jgi:hypothetical protein